MSLKFRVEIEHVDDYRFGKLKFLNEIENNLNLNVRMNNVLGTTYSVLKDAHSDRPNQFELIDSFVVGLLDFAKIQLVYQLIRRQRRVQRRIDHSNRREHVHFDASFVPLFENKVENKNL